MSLEGSSRHDMNCEGGGGGGAGGIVSNAKG